MPNARARHCATRRGPPSRAMHAATTSSRPRAARLTDRGVALPARRLERARAKIRERARDRRATTTAAASGSEGVDDEGADADAERRETSTTAATRVGAIKWKNKSELQAFLETLSETFPEELDEMRRKVRDDVNRASRSAVLLMCAQLCFVGAMCASAQSMEYFSAAQFTLARSALSLPFVYLLAKTRGETMRELNNVKKRKALRSSLVMIMLAACVCLAQICLAYGLKRASIGNAVVLGQLVSVYSCTIAVFQGIEKPSVGKFAAIAVSVIGTILLLDPARMWLSAGNVALLIRAAAFAAYLAFQESILRTYHPVTVAVVSQFMGAVIGIVISLPLVLREHFFVENPIAIVTQTSAWAAVAAVGILSSAAYALTTRAEADTTPVVTACYGSLQPIFAGIIMSAGGGGGVLVRDAFASALILMGSIFAAAKSTLERSDIRVLKSSQTWNTMTGDPTIALPQSKSTASYPAPIDMTIDFDGDFDVSATFDADEGGTMIMRKSGSVSRREIIDEDRGTIRLRRKSRRTSIQRSAVWTIAWAVVLSIVSLAGAGLIGWYGIYLYWRFFC